MVQRTCSPFGCRHKWNKFLMVHSICSLFIIHNSIKCAWCLDCENYWVIYFIIYIWFNTNKWLISNFDALHIMNDGWTEWCSPRDEWKAKLIWILWPKMKEHILKFHASRILSVWLPLPLPLQRECDNISASHYHKFWYDLRFW